jgi:hypothetical protein
VIGWGMLSSVGVKGLAVIVLERAVRGKRNQGYTLRLMKARVVYPATGQTSAHGPPPTRDGPFRTPSCSFCKVQTRLLQQLTKGQKEVSADYFNGSFPIKSSSSYCKSRVQTDLHYARHERWRKRHCSVLVATGPLRWPRLRVSPSSRPSKERCRTI